ncbi:MAG: tetratricopeptide repeat protein [Methanobrevibacter sp.]|uniref:HIRAN domain-containing protein n=1 Tax=Methanobrevibacter sp. TaxID=66852 RepID=UPI0025E1076C|nr:HIRAN domain-containing protein [Methanobrevibacter sp.]MBE6507892.1 tetratricopeptide repeat protein [Methanobrevibacter sp.]
MDEWKVGDPADWGDSVGVPDIPYMGYMDDDEDNDDFRKGSRKSRAERLCDEAWDLWQKGQYRDALESINAAIHDNNQNPEFYNVRAIIRQDLHQYEDSLNDYNKSLRMQGSQVVRNNKAHLLYLMSNEEKLFTGNFERGLELINDALKLTDDDFDRKTFLRRKGEFLDKLGRKLDSAICFLLASESYDLIDEVERQTKILKDSNETFICIAGTEFFKKDKPLSEGMVVSLVRESDNEHDPDAILVRHEGKPVGYVANSSYTLIDEAKSASEIKDTIKDCQKAKILFTYLAEYIVAKLI